MKTDQQFWEDVATTLAPVILRETMTSDNLVRFLAQEKQHASSFAAELAAKTADQLLLLRNRRIETSIGAAQERAVEESAETS